MHEQVGSVKFVSLLLKHAGNSEHVVAPCSGALPGKVIEIKVKIPGKFLRANHKFSV